MTKVIKTLPNGQLALQTAFCRERIALFSKVLIANRGEIAIRIARACRELNIRSAAVYSEADLDSAHLRFADEAYSLGAKATKDTYLNPEKIVEAALKAGAEVIHPGYGFLSENPSLGLLAKENNIALIAPNPETIELMGSKLSARSVAMKAGIPVVPGTDTPVSSQHDIVDFGKEYGWPVAIKASYGGGGRGLVVVYTPEEAASALERAKREAAASFGLDEAYLERYLEKPRHIEVQILADTHGNTVAVGDRDCSLQRRHQKLMEEAPIPFISEEIRESILSDGEKLAKQANYLGAGTVEMLYEDEKHYFLEMNTRIQVEHPITEMVTGIDLVQAQIRIAAGEKLWFDRYRHRAEPRIHPAIRQYGHAIEARINAEDPSGGKFTPSPGLIKKADYPTGPFVRVDAGYYQNDVMPGQFDSLLAKVCAWGSTREEARMRLLRALGEMHIKGIHTTKELSKLLLGNQDFIDNTHTTKTVENSLDYTLLDTDTTDLEPIGESETDSIKDLSVEMDGRKYDVKIRLDNDLANLIAGGVTSPATKKKSVHKKTDSLQITQGDVTSPMQGTVISLNVSEGETVANGQLICIIEAMKMENPIHSPVAGKVTNIFVGMGDSIIQGSLIAQIEP
ncbi:MAG: carbamoyl phosphate synthase [Firmicutes bacterium]|nr:carbamoyl phosphate synthase [Bacillota bacterium]